MEDSAHYTFADTRSTRDYSYPSSLAKSKAYFEASNRTSKRLISEIAKQQGPTIPVRPAVVRSSPTERTFDVLGQASGALGAASAFAPALAPVAAAAGLGYGIYKLGHSFDIW